MAKNMMMTRFSVNTLGADYLFAQADKIAQEATKSVLEGIKDDIRASWSPNSPSAPFTPPSVVTGFLDQSIKQERRDQRGRFAAFGQAVTWLLRVEAEYGMALEFGRGALLERPFYRPAVKRAENKLGTTISGEFKSQVIRANALTKAQFLARKGF